MATHFSILAWEIPWAEELAGYSPRGCKRAGHKWTTKQQQVCPQPTSPASSSTTCLLAIYILGYWPTLRFSDKPYSLCFRTFAATTFLCQDPSFPAWITSTHILTLRSSINSLRMWLPLRQNQNFHVCCFSPEHVSQFSPLCPFLYDHILSLPLDFQWYKVRDSTSWTVACKQQKLILAKLKHLLEWKGIYWRIWGKYTESVGRLENQIQEMVRK